MGSSTVNEHLAHRPGAASAFFVYKASLFGASFWGWLAVLVLRGGPITGWHVAAAGAAITTTLVAVVLGVRHALQRNAAARHEQIMRTLVELSWYPFGQSAHDRDAHDTDTHDSDTHDTDAHDGGAEVIPLPRESRRRPRR